LRGLTLAAGILCFGSGVAGLTYEVIWLRELAVLVGGASGATAAVLSTVMGGMGVGAWLGGRWAGRLDPRGAMRAYGAVELALGVCVLLQPPLVDGLEVLAPTWLADTEGWTLGAMRLVLAGLVVLLPATMMGASLPLLVRALGRREDAGRTTSVLYALNTAGAALGSVLAAYVLLGAWGVRGTARAAAWLDFAVGAMAFALAMALGRTPRRAAGKAAHTRTRAAAHDPHALEHDARDASPDRDAEVRAPRSPEATPIAPRLALVAAAVSGAVALGWETVWTRYLLVVFGHDVHAFASMLASMLVGLAAGSAGYRVLSRRRPAWTRASAWVAVLFAGFATLTLLTWALVGRRYLAVGADVFGVAAHLSVTEDHLLGLRVQGLFALSMVFPPALFAGAIMPSLVAAHRRTASAGRRAGEVLAANTLGAIAGALLTPYLLVSAFGVQGAGVALALLALGAAFALSGGSRRVVVTAALAFVVALASMPTGLPRRTLAAKMGPAHLRFVHYEEAATGTVSVTVNTIHGERQLLVNGINEVTTRLVHDQSFALLGHLGLLLHPAPREVGVVCLGAGLSAGAVSTHEDVEHIDVVDLLPEVAGGARHFGDLNHGVLDDPRLHLVRNDGRNHLATSPQRYDVLVVDSTHPRAVDSWMLYTRELYEVARAALRDGGVFVQWVPLHGSSVDELRILAGTFARSFERASLFVNAGFETYGEAGYALFVGGRDVDVEVMGRRIRGPAREDLQRWGMGTLPEILECFVAGRRAMLRWSAGLPLNTDAHPRTEHLTRYSGGAPMTNARLLEVAEPVWERVPMSVALEEEMRRRWLPQALVLAGRRERAAELCGGCRKHPQWAARVRRGAAYYRALGERYPEDAVRSMTAARGLAAHGGDGTALAARATTLRPQAPRLWAARGRLTADDAEAVACFRRALDLEPELVVARLGLGARLVRMGRAWEAAPVLAKAVETEPELAATHDAYGWALSYVGGRGAEAERHLRRALALEPRSLRARLTLARLLLAAGDAEDAYALLRAGRELHPVEPDLLYAVALAAREVGRDAEAEEALTLALRITPDDVMIAATLEEILARREP